MTLRDQIINDEGLQLTVYKDSLGKDTIGCGHLMANPLPGAVQSYLNENGCITQDMAFDMLDEDIEHARSILLIRLPWIGSLNEVRQDVLIEMVYQLGINGVMAFKKMLNALQEGNFDLASFEMLNSYWHFQTPQRCERLANVILTGECV